jgi:LysR family transcriptional regulator for bpeEF and oprC
MDHLYCMRVFARVVEHGSFTRAAEHFEVSKPTVTLAVAQLERHLHTRLLHRTTRRLSLTDEGRLYYERCLRILDDVSEADDAVSSAKVEVHGRLRVSVPVAFTHLTFFSALPRFLARHPKLELEIIVSDRALNLVEEGIDCAARGVGIPDDSMLVARHIMTTRWITCASPAYFAARGVPQSIADLEQHNCVRFISPSTGRVAAWQFEENGTRVTRTPRSNLAVTSLDAAVSAAVAGIAIAQVPDPIVFHRIQSGDLRAVLVDRWATAAPLCVVYPSTRYLTAKVKAFADFLGEIYPASGWWPEIAELAATNMRRLAKARRARR